MDKERLLDIVLEYGYCTYDIEETRILDELEKEGWIIRVDKIPHNAMMLNPAYTYVSNDERGRDIAVKAALFTIYR